MARDLNRHECIARLGQDPELKYTNSGKAVVSISVACGESWKDKQTGQKQEKTEWIRYVAFDKLAETIGQYLKKGSKVYLDGKLTTRKWTDQNGVERYSTEIVANNMQMIDSRGDNASQGAQQPQGRPQQPQGQPQQNSYPPQGHAPPQSYPQQGAPQYDQGIPDDHINF